MIPRLGTPYAFPSNPPESFDCWTLLVYLREQLGLDTPVMSPHWTPETLNGAIEGELCSGRWKPVTEAVDGDVVLFSPVHVGALLRGVVVHAVPSTGVLYSALAVARRRFPDLGIYRPC